MSLRAQCQRSLAYRPRAVALLGWAVAVSASARATAAGLVQRSDDAERADLSVLRSLEMQASLSEQSTSVTETRTYARGAGPATFYRSLVGPTDAAATEVLVDGVPVEGVVLPVAEADAVRRRLALELSESTPLREYRTPLLVVDVPAGASQAVITLTTTGSLSPYGTLHGFRAPVDWNEHPVDTVTLDVQVEREIAARVLYAPYHDLTVERDGDRVMRGTFARRSVYTELDVTVLLSTGTEPLGIDLVPFRYSGAEGGYYLAKIAADAPPGGQAEPRDLAFAVDVSGSMGGAKIEQARDALVQVLSELGAQDSFGLVTFSDTTRTFRSRVVSATGEDLASGFEFVRGLEAGGGTNLHDGLAEAFDTLPDSGGRPRYVVLLTDGQPTVGVTDAAAIADLAASRSNGSTRVFSFGVGHDVNTILLDRIARDTAGDALYVDPGESVTTAVTAFFSQIADPVLSDPVLDSSAFATSAQQPAVLQDFFGGRTTAVLGRYAAPGTGTWIIRGRRSGQPHELTYAATLPEYDVTSGFVPRVWALRRVGTLLEEIKLGGSPALEDELLALARRFGIGTAFTAYVPDEAGDTRMVYTAASSAAVGADAVQTSSLLDGYTKTASVDVALPPMADVRYRRDRAFPLQGGYYTDSSLAEDPQWIDVRFGSDRYVSLLEGEAHLGIAELLAVAPNVKFEHLGRAFRVSDGTTLDGELGESVSIPPPAFGAEPGVTAVQLEASTMTDPSVPTQAEGTETTPGDHRASTDDLSRGGCACAAAPSGPPVGAAAWAGALFVFSGVFRRVRRRAMWRR